MREYRVWSMEYGRRATQRRSANGRLGTAVPTGEGGAFEGTRGHGDTGTRGVSEGRERTAGDSRPYLRGRSCRGGTWAW